MIVASSGGAVVAILFALVLLWVVPIFVGGKVTAGKGRGQAPGVLLGVFLGWIGVLIAAMLRSQSAR